jgi:hypothetical protein
MDIPSPCRRAMQIRIYLDCIGKPAPWEASIDAMFIALLTLFSQSTD